MTIRVLSSGALSFIGGKLKKLSRETSCPSRTFRQSLSARPVKELKGFQKVSLNPGQTRTVTFEITPGMLQYYDDAKGAWVAEPGAFTAYVGAASDDIRGTVEFELK